MQQHVRAKLAVTADGRDMAIVLHGGWLCLLGAPSLSVSSLTASEVSFGLSPLWSYADFTAGFLLVQMLGSKGCFLL